MRAAKDISAPVIPACGPCRKKRPQQLAMPCSSEIETDGSRGQSRTNTGLIRIRRHMIRKVIQNQRFTTAWRSMACGMGQLPPVWRNSQWGTHPQFLVRKGRQKDKCTEFHGQPPVTTQREKYSLTCVRMATITNIISTLFLDGQVQNIIIIKICNAANLHWIWRYDGDF